MDVHKNSRYPPSPEREEPQGGHRRRQREPARTAHDRAAASIHENGRDRPVHPDAHRHHGHHRKNADKSGRRRERSTPEHELVSESLHKNGHTPTLKDPGNGYATGGEIRIRKRSRGLEQGNDEEDHEIALKNEKRRNKEPFKYCSWIVNYPKVAFGVFLCASIAMFVATGALVLTGYDLFPIEFESLPMQLWDDDSFLRQLAWFSKDNGNPRKLTQFVQSEATSSAFDVLELYYDTDGGNILTADNLRAIQEIENKLVQIEKYQSTYCLLDASGACQKPISILRYFDGTFNQTVSGLYDPNFSNISGIMKLALARNETKVKVIFHLGTDLNENTYSTSIIRSSIPIGVSRSLSNPSRIESRDDIRTYVQSPLKPVLHDIRDEYKKDPFEFVFFTQQLWFREVIDQAMKDMMLAAGSLAFIFVYMCFITRSVWISALSMFSVLSCFVCTNLIYRIVLDFRYLGFFHVLSLFIILGVGADNIFVFYDTWKASAHERYKSLAHRLSDCYRRAAETMLYTSVTTAVAFFATAFSPLLAVRSFGVFSGVLILVNYLSVITYFPTVVIMYHLKFEHWKGPCGCCCSKGEPAVKGEVEPVSRSQQNRVVRFFRGPFFKLISQKVARFFILLLLAGVVAFFSYWASTLVADDEEMKIYKPDHLYGKAREHRLSSFKASENDNFIPVFFVWGLANRDLSDCHRTDYKCVGTARYDVTFDLNPPDTQLAMAGFCSRLHNMTAAEAETRKIRRDPITDALQIDCPITSLQRYLQAEQNRVDPSTGLRVYPASLDLSLPLTKAKVTGFMNLHPDIYNVSTLPPDFTDYFGIMVSYWMTTGYTMQPSADWYTYRTLLSEWKREDGSVNLVNGTRGKYYGTKLGIFAIQVNTTLKFGTVGYPIGLPVFEKYEELLDSERDVMPESLKGGFPVTRFSWHWLKVQKTLARTALNGILIGIALAFPILVVATRNFLIGTAAVLCICCSTVCVVGIIPLAGWKLGVLESLNLCLVVGLSVDYVVHLAEAYHMAPQKDRLGRSRDALEHLGVSVISGATTTLGASFFMIFSQIAFFMKFGLFLFAVIGFSIVFALFGFMTFMALAGPQGDMGSFKQLTKCCRRRRDKPVEENNDGVRMESSDYYAKGQAQGSSRDFTKF